MDRVMKILRLIGFLLVFSLVGCMTIVSSDSQLRLRGNEKWDLRVTFEVPSAEAVLYGKELGSQLNQIITSAESLGVIGKWEEGKVSSTGNKPYSIFLRGKSFDQLNSVFPGSINVEKTKVDGLNRVHVAVNSSDLLGSENSTFTLIGGKIVSSNGNQNKNNSVKWLNADDIEAYIEEPASPFWTYLLLILGSVFILLAIANASGMFQKKPHPMTYQDPGLGNSYSSISSQQFQPNNSEKVQSQVFNTDPKLNVTDTRSEMKFCPSCGNAIASNMTFCNRCGAKVRS